MPAEDLCDVMHVRCHLHTQYNYPISFGVLLQAGICLNSARCGRRPGVGGTVRQCRNRADTRDATVSGVGLWSFCSRFLPNANLISSTAHAFELDLCDCTSVHNFAIPFIINGSPFPPRRPPGSGEEAWPCLERKSALQRPLQHPAGARSLLLQHGKTPGCG